MTIDSAGGCDSNLELQRRRRGDLDCEQALASTLVDENLMGRPSLLAHNRFGTSAAGGWVDSPTRLRRRRTGARRSSCPRHLAEKAVSATQIETTASNPFATVRYRMYLASC